MKYDGESYGPASSDDNMAIQEVKQRVIGPGQILLGFLIVLSLQMLLFGLWLTGRKMLPLDMGIAAFIGVCEVVATNAYAQTLLENRQLRVDQYMMNHRKKP